VKDDRVYLQHIRDAPDDITTYCGSNRDGFFSNRMRQDATLRKLEVIGQAVKISPSPTKSRRPEVPWKQIAGMRDKVIHDYFGVNLETVWAVVERELPKLRAAIADLARRHIACSSDVPRCSVPCGPSGIRFESTDSSGHGRRRSPPLLEPRTSNRHKTVHDIVSPLGGRGPSRFRMRQG
jgi:uncharacterized protein with HEPN domain